MNHVWRGIVFSVAAVWLTVTAYAFSSSTAGAQTVGPNVNLTKAVGNQYEPAVAIDPNNSNNIFIVARNETGGLWSARSSDGGATWTSKLIAVSPIPPAGDVPRAYGNASVAWDQFGNLFLTYLSQGSPTAATYVTLAVSEDGGATFFSPAGLGPAMILPPYARLPSMGDQPTVAVGPGSAGFPGSVWLTFWSQGGIWVSGAGVSGLGVISAFGSQVLPLQPVGVNYGDIAVGPNGEVIVTYGPNAQNSPSYGVYVQTAPTGLGTAPYVPGSFAFNPPVQVTPVNVGGFTMIPAQPNWGVDPEAGLAWDRSGGAHNGRVYLVYTDSPALSTDLDIFVVHSDDKGTTWSAPVRVNDDTGTNSQFLPRISLDQTSGTVAVTWYDARNSGANNTAQYFGAISADGGATFAKNFQISTGTSDQANSTAAAGFRKADYGDYTGNAFVAGKLIAAWADNSNSTGDNPDGATNFDLYAAVIQVTPPASLQMTPATDIVASGIYGGQFSPTSFSYQLSATNGPANFAISNIPPWLTASFTSGTATASPLTVTFSLTSVGTLHHGTYSAMISFTNTTNGQGNTSRMTTLTVSPTERECENGGWRTFTSNPGPFANERECERYFDE